LRLIFAARKVQPNRWQASHCRIWEFCDGFAELHFLFGCYPRPTFSRAVYFQPDEILAANNGYPDRRGYRYPDAPSLYVRVIPRDAQNPLGNAEVKDLIGQHRLAPLFYRSGYSWALNRHGAIVFEAQSDTAEIFGATQVFRNREIWGIERTLLQPWDDPQKGRMKTISGKTYEEVLGRGIRHYLRFAREGLAISGPLIIEAGATRVEGYVMGMGQRYMLSEWGPIHQTDILWRGVLEDDGESAADAALLAIFDTFFDAAGERRPPHWNNFPPQFPSWRGGWGMVLL
jgi:hypothetical protein